MRDRHLMPARAAALEAAAREELRAVLAAIRCAARLARRRAENPHSRALACAVLDTVEHAERALTRLDRSP